MRVYRTQMKSLVQLPDIMEYAYSPPFLNDSDTSTPSGGTPSGGSGADGGGDALVPHSISKEYLILAVVLSLLSITGILGNIPVLIVYFRRKDKQASNTFIKILAFLDLLVCTMVIPYTIVYDLHLVNSDVVCRLFELMRHFAIGASNLTLVAIAVERYIAVCQIGTKINVKIINHGVIVIIFIGLLVAAPSIGTFAVVNDVDIKDVPCSFPHEIRRGAFCHFTYTIMGKDLVRAYQVIQMAVFFIILFVIIVLYIIVYVVLWNKTKIRNQLTKQRGKIVSELRRASLYSETTEKDCGQGDTETISDSSNASKTAALKHPRQPIDIVLSSNESLANKAESRVTFQKKTAENIIKTDVIMSTSGANAVVAKPVDSKKQLRFSFAKHDRPKRKRYYHRRTAKMLFLCTVIYFVTWLPFWLDIFGMTHSMLLRYLFFIGNATNPIIYGIVNQQIRRSFKRLFFQCLRKWFKLDKTSDDGDFTINGSFSGTV